MEFNILSSRKRGVYMRRLWLLLCTVILLGPTLPLTPSAAQSTPPDDPPLLLTGRIGTDNVGENLYRLEGGTWQQLPLTNFFDPVLSPTGEWLAYKFMPPFMTTLATDYSYLNRVGQDIGLYNVADSTTRVVAIQPTDIAFVDEGVINATTRSTPIWSPDGTQLAWTEQHYGIEAPIARLMLYDLATETITVLDAALPGVVASVDGLPRSLSWGSAGIAVFVQEGENFIPTLRLYDPADGSVRTVQVGDDYNRWGPVVGPLWATDTADPTKTWIILQDVEDYWLGVDVATLTLSGPIVPPLTLVSATAPDTSARLIWNFAPGAAPTQELLDPDGFTIGEWTSDPNVLGMVWQVAISPSGQAGAYALDGAVHVWRNGALFELPLPDGMNGPRLHWGPTTWQTSQSSHINPDGSMG